jgi:hypothetical protein
MSLRSRLHPPGPYIAKKSTFLWECRNKMGFRRVLLMVQSASPETGHWEGLPA